MDVVPWLVRRNPRPEVGRTSRRLPRTAGLDILLGGPRMMVGIFRLRLISRLLRRMGRLRGLGWRVGRFGIACRSFETRVCRFDVHAKSYGLDLGFCLRTGVRMCITFGAKTMGKRPTSWLLELLAGRIRPIAPHKTSPSSLCHAVGNI
jgi:hypothetical protein